ncbi:Uncharacterized protein APZ42_003923, partial [Daphnia magna]
DKVIVVFTLFLLRHFCTLCLILYLKLYGIPNLIILYYTILYHIIRTPNDWYNFCREVSEDIVINNSEKIGGVGITVEIDESKFGKKKYNRGKR